MITPVTRQETFSELASERSAAGCRSDIQVYWSSDVDTLLSNQKTTLTALTASISAGLNSSIANCVHQTGTENVSGQKSFDHIRITATATSAASGGMLVPPTCAGFFIFYDVAGTARKVPYYV